MKRTGRALPAPLLYTLLFIPVFLLSRGIFILAGRLPMWQVDGIMQYYPFLEALGSRLRAAIASGSLEGFSFSLGFGQDVLITLNYYGLGDPLMLLTALFSGSGCELCFVLILTLRIWCAGMAAVLLGRCYGFERRSAVCAGLIYVLSSGMLLSAETAHYIFLLPYIHFPLILLGLEYAMNGRKRWILALSVAWCALCGFYFLFGNLLLALLYALLRHFTKGEARAWKRLPGAFLRCAVPIAIGLCLSAAVLLPATMGFLNGQRTGTAWDLSRLRLLWSLKELKRLPQAIMTGKGLGAVPFVSALGIVSLLYVLLHGTRSARALLIATGVLLLIPATGTVLNGMAYETQRWGYAPCLLVALLTAGYLPDALRQRRRGSPESVIMGAIILLFACYTFTVSKRAIRLLLCAELVLLSAAWCLPDVRRHPLACRRAAAALLAVQLLLVFGFDAGQRLRELIPRGQAEALARGVYSDVEPSEGTARTDISQSAVGTALNGATMTDGVNGTCLYASILPGGFSSLYRSLAGSSAQHVNAFMGLDARAALEALFGVDTYLTDDTDTRVPYGFVPDGTTQNGYHRYRNTNTLPIAYAQTSVITGEEFDRLDPLRRQWALLQCAVVSQPETEVAHRLPEQTLLELSAPDVESDGIDIEDGYWRVDEKGSATLRFSAPANCELYLEIDGFHTDGWSGDLGQRMRVECGGITADTLVFSDEQLRAPGTDTVQLCLGYAEEARSEAILRFSFSGRVAFSGLRLYAQPMDGFDALVSGLAERGLTNVRLGRDSLSGDIRTEAPAIVVTSIPYSEGWSVRVDGEAARSIASAGALLAVEVPTGTHHIEWSYRTPWLTQGCVLSAVGLLLLIGMLLWDRRRRKETE